jgi:hypothetical protein
MLHGRGHFVMAQISPSETDAETSSRRPQGKSNLVAGMEANPYTGNGSTNSALGIH